jgi:hypothetical protein
MNKKVTMLTIRRIFAEYSKPFQVVSMDFVLLKFSVMKIAYLFYEDLHCTTLQGLHKTTTEVNFMECIPDRLIWNPT